MGRVRLRCDSETLFVTDRGRECDLPIAWNDVARLTAFEAGARLLYRDDTGRVRGIALRSVPRESVEDARSAWREWCLRRIEAQGHLDGGLALDVGEGWWA